LPDNVIAAIERTSSTNCSPIWAQAERRQR